MTTRGNAKILFKRLTDVVVAAAVITCTAVSASGQSSTMIYEGFTEPKFDILVAATEIGRLESVLVDLGDHVEAGQVIGQLEDTLQTSSVRIATLQSDMRGEITAAKAEWKHHHNRTEHLRVLAADEMARPDELARAETDLQIAEAQVTVAEEQLKLRLLELERYQLQVTRRKIHAPMDGVISEVFHQPGEYITPGDPAVARLLVMKKIRAVFNVPVEDTVSMKAGTPVQVFLRSNSVTVESTISSIAPDIDGESGTVQVRVELDNMDGRFLAGDRCTLQLASSHASSDSKQASAPSSSLQIRRNSLR